MQVTADKAVSTDTVIFEGPPMMEQKLWPKHCVQQTWGAELHPDLKVRSSFTYYFDKKKRNRKQDKVVFYEERNSLHLILFRHHKRL